LTILAQIRTLNGDAFLRDQETTGGDPDPEGRNGSLTQD
jgi:hypothetical protein